jgi:enterochelin esterase-like enzyme
MKHCRALLLGFAALLPAATAQAGELRRVTLESAVLGRPWEIGVYLPRGHATSGLRYPVLFFLPGDGVPAAEFPELGIGAAANAAIAAGRMPPAVIVVPEIGRSWGVDAQERMQTALAEELLPEAARRWRGLDGRRGQVVGGISAGGYAALRLDLLHPERFAAAVLLSPAVYVPQPPQDSGARRAGAFGLPLAPEAWAARNYPALLPAFRARGLAMPIFVAAGVSDHLGIAAEIETLRDTWQAEGMPVEMVLVPGGHAPAVWRGLMPQALAYAFRHTDAPRH